MDPVALFRNYHKQEGKVTLHNQDGLIVNELPQCVSIKIGTYIYPRDTLTNIRSKRGAGDYYPLDAIYFLVERREAGYGEYMQEARRLGVVVVSLVDRKDVINYVTEGEECGFVDLEAPFPTPRRTFGVEEVTESLEEEEITKVDAHKPVKKRAIEFRPARKRDSNFESGRDFTNVLELAKEIHRSLGTVTESSGNISTTKSAKQPISLIEQLSSANQPTPTSKPTSSKAKFIPIIIVPASPSATLTMFNVLPFLEQGRFLSTAEAKSQGRSKENILNLTHKFGDQSVTFQIMDNPTRLSPGDWNRIMAVFVQGNSWQFKGWKWESPVELLQNVKGFHLEFDEARRDPNLDQWKVTKLNINRTKRHLDSSASFQFWTVLESFLKSKNII